MEIKRKPAPRLSPVEYGVVQRPLTPTLPPPYSRHRFRPPSPSTSFTSSSLQPPRAIPRYRSQPDLRDSFNTPAAPSVPRAETSLPADKPSFYADARHFLGGLIHHPSESTKHYSILRHSHGIVFYRGPSTSVTVSIFADTPLPADQSLWLQCKGWSGKTGMRAKALLRLHDDWVNVSPSVTISADAVESTRERAWQRDIAKFYKKAPTRVRDTHRLRETVVARIPPDAEDGYFQLVLCQGEKKVLCRSPVFRILSASTDPSSLRGASLKSLPLEIGALVVGTYAQAAVSRVVTPVTTVASTASAPYRPGWIQETAAMAAYEASGRRNRSGQHTTNPSAPYGLPPSIEDGPQPPFPFEFTARSSEILDPTRISLNIPSYVEDKLCGFFFSWARAGSDQPWQMSVFSVRSWDGSHATGPVSLSQSTRKIAVLHFIHDPIPHPARTISIRILGFLHPDIPPPSARTERDLLAAREAAAEAAMLSDEHDTEYTQWILDHPLWGPEAAAAHRGWVDRTKDSCGSVITRGQKMIERIGVRSGREQEAVGGYYIVRD